MTGITAGKLWGMRRLADAAGHFRMLATDQRPPIMEMIRARTGAPALYADIAEVKRMLVAALADDVSAVLTDPVWGYPAALPHLRADRGLILTLEDHEYDETPEGRRSRVIAGWSAAAIRRVGADAVKLLAWFRPDAGAAVVDHQLRFAAAADAACRAADIPFVLELLVHPFGQGGGADYATDPDKRPDLVLDSLRAFVEAGVAADVWKLESPLPPAQIPDPDGKDAAAVQRLFDRMGALATAPWVMLSGGADRTRFRWILTYACRAGASGFLAGRTIWAEAFRAWPDRAAAEAALRGEARERLRGLNDLTARLALPWHRHPAYGDAPVLRDGGERFAPAYGTGWRAE